MKPIFISFLVFFIPFISMAGKEKFVSAPLTGRAISSSKELTVEDPYFESRPVGMNYKSSKGTFALEIDMFHANLVNIRNFNTTVTVKLICFTKSGENFTKDVDLKVEYRNNPDVSSLASKDVAVIPDCYKIIAFVVGNPILTYLDGVGGTTQSLPNYIFLQAGLEVERYYDLDINQIPFMANLEGSSIVTSVEDNELVISWPLIQGAEEYELEYTYVDDYQASESVEEHSLLDTKEAKNLSYDFRFNSTRVRIAANSYKIPVLYERGYLLYRLRAVGRGGVNFNKDIFSKWTSDQFADDNKFEVSNFGHKIKLPIVGKTNLGNIALENINFQYSSMFAEDGKRKDVVNYADGSLRTRQSVTKNNSDDNLIIAETFYDHAGRAVLQAMPVPVSKNSTYNGLHYARNFNLNKDGVKFSKSDFDLDMAIGSCNPKLNSGLSTSKGAGFYYSPINTQPEEGYVPDAEGFPIMQTEYEPDNTGRVRAQGGVGKTHQLNNGHDTKNYYAQPDQIKLDRILGSDAGFASHYKMNVVKDANEQSSVTYMNESGKVIATSLIGTPSPNTLPLNSNASKPLIINSITDDCIYGCKGNGNFVDHNALIYSKELIVEKKAIYTFNYDIQQAKAEYQCNKGTAPQALCDDCEYLLSFELLDDCGKIVSPSAAVTIPSYIGNPATTICSDNPKVSIAGLTFDLNEGKYTLNKKLQIKQEAADAFVKFVSRNCMPDTAGWYKEEINKLILSGNICSDAVTDCKGCIEEANRQLTSYIKAYRETNPTKLISDEQLKIDFGYEDLKEECEQFCEPLDVCESSKMMMLSDVSPGGQYAKSGQNPEHWALSLFNINNLLPRGRINGLPNAYFRNPNPQYADDEGNLAFIEITPKTSSPINSEDFSPAVFIIELYYLLEDGEGINYVKATMNGNNTLNMDEYEAKIEAGYVLAVKPQHLLKDEDFKAHWKPSWAASLLRYHPEYCYYENCKKNSIADAALGYISAQFDDRLQIIDTWSDATSAHTSSNDGLTIGRFQEALVVESEAINLLSNHDFLLKNDPYFKSGDGASSKTNFLNLLTVYKGKAPDVLSLKEYVAISQRCPSYYHANMSSFKNSGDGCTAFGTDFYPSPTNNFEREENKRIKDQEWTMYNSLYQSEKQKLQQIIADKYCTSSTVTANNIGGLNTCIGNPNYQPYVIVNKLLTHGNNFFWSEFLGFPENNGLRGTFNVRERMRTLGQPCNWFMYKLYANKIKRFANGEDLNYSLDICEGENSWVSAKKSKDKADLEYFLKTGQDNVTQSLEYFLMELAQTGKIIKGSIAPQPVKKLKSFSQALYNHIKYGEEKSLDFIDPNPYTNIFFNSTADNLTWTGTFSPSSICGSTKLTLPTETLFQYATIDLSSGKNIYYQIPLNFDNGIQTLSAFETGTDLPLGITKKFTAQISSLGNLAPLNKVDEILNFSITSTFTIKDEFGKQLTSTTVDMTGTTCFPLNQKDYSKVCTPTKEAEGIIKLLNAMTGNGDVKPSESNPNVGILLNDNEGTQPRNIYNPDFSPYLKNYLNTLINSSNSTNPWYFTSLPQNNSATITISKSKANTDVQDIRLVMTLSPEAPSALPANFDIANVRAITCFRNLGATNMFGVTAMYFDPEKPAIAGSYDFRVTLVPRQEGQSVSPDFPILKCGPPKPQECKSVAHENTQSLQNFLNDLINRRPVTQEVSPNKFVMTGNSMLTAGHEGISADISLSFSNFLRNQLIPEKQYYFNNILIGGIQNRRQLSADLSCQSLTVNNLGTITPNLIPVNGASPLECEKCQIKLEYIQEIPGIEFTNFVGFEGLTADFSNAPNGITYDFFVTGIYFKDEKFITTKLKGSSCFPVANCESVCSQGRKELLTNGNFNNPITEGVIENNKISYQGLGYKSDYILKIIPECNVTGGICLNQNEGVVSKNARLVHKDFERIDHTGNNGYLFVFNGKKDIRAWFTNLVVSKNKNYRFSASLSNVCVGCSNNCRFKFYYKSKGSEVITGFIDTDIILYSQGWVTTNYQFKSDVEGEVEIGIIAMAPIGQTIEDNGYDFALDDVSFSEFCNERIPLFPDYPESASNPCDEELNALANASKMQRLKVLEPDVNVIRTSYVNSCLKAKENLNHRYNSQEHHYTLYYYDQAGNLLKTVPPEGVEVLDQTRDADKLAAITSDRLNNTYTLSAQPRHTMASNYKYNSLNQLVQQSVPDNDQINLLENALSSGIDFQHTPTNVQLGEGNEGFLLAQDATRLSHLYHTSNGGTNWGEVSGVGIENINRVKFVDPQSPMAYAVGDKGTVLVTNNTGTTWTAEQIGSSGDLIDLHIFNPGNVIILERNGLLWRTAAGSWQSFTSLSELMKGDLQQIAFVANTGYAVSKDANRGYLYKSENQGGSWVDISSTINTGTLSKISFFDKNNGIAYASQSILLNTKDGGKSWKIIPTNLPFDEAFDLVMTGVNKACILSSGSDGYNLYRATDNLASWTPIQNIGNGYEKFSKSADGTLFATGASVKILSSINGGDNWALYDDLTSVYEGYTISSISSPDANTVFTARFNGQIYKSTRTPSGHIQIPSPSNNIINIHFASKSKACVLVNGGYNYGEVYYTNNADATAPKWSVSESTTYYNISNFMFYNATNGFGYLINGTSLMIYKTSDAGVYWEVVNNELPIYGYIKDFKFFDSQNGFIITSTGNIYTTTTGGSNWTQGTNLSTFPHALTTIAMSTGKAVIGGDLGFIMNYSNGWFPQRSNLNSTISALAFSSVNNVVAATNNTAIYSDNAGNTWKSATGMVGIAKTIAFTTSTNGTAVGNGGLILTTANGGISWLPRSPTNSTNLNNIAANIEKNIIVGDAGTILTGTTTFIPLKGVAPMNLSGASLVKGSSVGYVVGAMGAVAKTTDQGKTWKLLAFPSAKNLHGVFFLSEQVGVVVGESGAVYKTTDGGLIWKVASVPSAVFTKTMYSIALSGNNGYIAADGMLLGSSDGGSTWTVKKTITSKAYAITTTDDKTAYAVGTAGMIYKTADAGASWTEMQKKKNNLPPVNWTTNDLKSVRFTTYLTGYAVGKSGTLLKTINEGASWKQVGDKAFSGDIEDISFSNTNHAAIAGINAEGGMGIALDDYTDEISSRFWYDELGRMIISQNAKQFKAQNFSYTDYDALGRIREVGEINKIFNSLPALNNIGQITLPAFTEWLNPSKNERKQVTRTYYDRVHRVADLAAAYIKQENLRTRVASIVYNETVNNTYDRVGAGFYQHATHYSYDIHGNVKSILQDNPEIPFSQGTDKQRYKKIDYTYDLISGNVNEVQYQPGESDQFLHRYSYDADNRITSVETSTDGVSWSRDAKYFYYKHGPLKRTELGEYKVQGTDYVYTLQGWIKGVNSNTLVAQRDPGKDGDVLATNVNRYIAADAFSYSLGYFNGDYKPIQPKTTADYFLASTSGFTELNALAPDLYNGNIGQMVTSIKDIKTEASQPQLTLYQYDQLNRIKEMKAYRDINLATNAWGSGTNMDASYQTSVSYDANGNITTMKRNGVAPKLVMDDMTYMYENVANGFVKNTNKLRQVKDVPSAYDTDIDGQVPNNYSYDEIGNLIEDQAEKINSIEWSVYGKPLRIVKGSNDYTNTMEIVFRYDALGNRTAKIIKPLYGFSSPETWQYTFYVRDASGNVMATYDRSGISTLALGEQSIYGSSRLGVQKRNLDLVATTPTATYKYYINQKYYELSDHRGNVNTTISDFRIGVGRVDNPRVLSHYTAVIRSTADYGVWGDELVGRGERSKDFRYGFNGQERDDEIVGSGAIYNYGMRIYDARLGRFLSIDPLSDNFPYYTPYQFAGNKPIEAIDLDGMEELSNKVINNVRFIVLKNVSFKTIIRDAQNSLTTEMQKADQTNQGDYMINGQQYEAKPGTNPAYVSAMFPQPDYQSQGQNVQSGKVVEGRSSEQTFYIAISKAGNVSSGQGNPPAGSETGFGGGVPIMINGMQYGEVNIWKPNTPGSVTKNATGPVSAANMQYLDQKSSSGYGLQNANDVGKTVLGYNSKKNVWAIASQQNGVEGMSMDKIKSTFISAGFDNIMSFDGSNSATLMKDQTLLTKPAHFKNNTAPSGVKLSVPIKK